MKKRKMFELGIYLYFWGFLSVLLLPLLIYPFVKGKLDHNNYENRELTDWNTVKASTWKNLSANLELYLTDNIPYKNEIVKLNKKIDLKIFHDLYDSSVLVGKENWLFYKKDNCIQDYRGDNLLSDEELLNYKLAAESLQEKYLAMDRKFCIMITPNKEEIYGDLYLPDKVKVKSEISKADLIVAYLQENTTIPIIYPKQALSDARDSGYTVWRKYDTHWNDVGAFIASQELLKCLGSNSVAIEQCEVVENGTISGDLANMLGLGKEYSDDIAYRIEGYLDEIHVNVVENIPQEHLNYVKTESDVLNGKSIMMIGDSFLGAMEQFISLNYENAVYIHRGNYQQFEEDKIETEDPDIIVFQIAERFIGGFDEFMWKFGEDN